MFFFHPSHRLGGKRIVRPEMFGVAALQFLFHLRIAALPEGAEIGGDLDRPPGGGKEVKEQRHPAAADGRGDGLAEHLLEADGEHRRLVRPIVDADL